METRLTEQKKKMTGNGRYPELLCPANNLEVLKVAVLYGADAVYIGGEAFSLRAGAKNFSQSDMAEGIAFAHAHHVSVYVTANILAHNDDLEQAETYFRELASLGPDAILISDPGLFMISKRVCPNIPVHISTQANNVNYGTFRFWYDLGVRRVVCGRELSLREICQIREHIPEDMEIEAFVHGAMCISYSGRCLLSNFLTGRDANRGACTHPCRWRYSLMEETRPGEYMPVFENERGTYIFNSKDLCMIGHIPELISAGIDSLKIEGRMKTALYVATVARTYRKAIDDYLKDPALYESNMSWYLEQIASCTYREFTTGFFFGRPDETAQIYDENTYRVGFVYLGITGDEKDGYFSLQQRNKFSVGETVQIMKPSGKNIDTRVIDILDENGIHVDSAPHPKQELWVKLEVLPERWDIIRRKCDTPTETVQLLDPAVKI